MQALDSALELTETELDSASNPVPL
jgi:hypothetical protein